MNGGRKERSTDVTETVITWGTGSLVIHHQRNAFVVTKLFLFRSFCTSFLSLEDIYWEMTDLSLMYIKDCILRLGSHPYPSPPTHKKKQKNVDKSCFLSPICNVFRKHSLKIKHQICMNMMQLHECSTRNKSSTNIVFILCTSFLFVALNSKGFMPV